MLTPALKTKVNHSPELLLSNYCITYQYNPECQDTNFYHLEYQTIIEVSL
jgi:hypothetical protein